MEEILSIVLKVFFISIIEFAFAPIIILPCPHVQKSAIWKDLGWLIFIVFKCRANSVGIVFHLFNFTKRYKEISSLTARLNN